MEINDRHRQALALLAQGVTHREVARTIGVDSKTLSRWKNDPDFARERNLTKEISFERGRQKIAEHYDQLLDSMLEIATDNSYKPSDRIKAFEALSRVGGADKDPPKTPNIQFPNRSITPQEALEGWQTIQANLQALILHQIVEGAASGTLEETANSIEALYRIAAIAKDFAKLQVPERLFDIDGDRHASDDVIDILLEGGSDAGNS